MRSRLWYTAVAVLVSTAVQAATFSIDPAHSSVSFRVKHVVGKVAGHFNKIGGQFDYDQANPKLWNAQATIEAASIDTGIEKRDTHLRSPDFLDVQKYPTITFKSTGITDLVGDKAKLHGELTIHGVTKPVILDLELGGLAKDPMGKGQRAGATATTHINRNDFGVGPTSGPIAGMVGNDVEITIEVEGVSKS